MRGQWAAGVVDELEACGPQSPCRISALVAELECRNAELTAASLVEALLRSEGRVGAAAAGRAAWVLLCRPGVDDAVKSLWGSVLANPGELTTAGHRGFVTRGWQRLLGALGLVAHRSGADGESLSATGALPPAAEARRDAVPFDVAPTITGFVPAGGPHAGCGVFDYLSRALFRTPERAQEIRGMAKLRDVGVPTIDVDGSKCESIDVCLEHWAGGAHHARQNRASSKSKSDSYVLHTLNIVGSRHATQTPFGPGPLLLHVGPENMEHVNQVAAQVWGSARDARLCDAGGVPLVGADGEVRLRIMGHILKGGMKGCAMLLGKKHLHGAEAGRDSLRAFAAVERGALDDAWGNGSTLALSTAEGSDDAPVFGVGATPFSIPAEGYNTISPGTEHGAWLGKTTDTE